MPRHKNQANFDSDTKTKHFSTPTQKTSNSDPGTEIKLSLIHHTEIKSFSTTNTKKVVQFDPPPQIKSISTHYLNQVSFHPHPIFRSVLMPRQKNQVHFDTDTETKLFSTPTPEPSQFRYLHCIQVKSDLLH